MSTSTSVESSIATPKTNDRLSTVIFSAVVAVGAWLLARFIPAPLFFLTGAFGFIVLGFLIGAMDLATRWKVFIGLAGFGYFFGTWEHVNHPQRWVYATALLGSGGTFLSGFMVGAYQRYIRQAREIVRQGAAE